MPTTNYKQMSRNPQNTNTTYNLHHLGISSSRSLSLGRKSGCLEYTERGRKSKEDRETEAKKVEVVLGIFGKC
jgi:hypothetical protein